MNACLVLFGLAVGCAAPAPPVRDAWLGEDKLRHFAMSFSLTGMTYGAARLGLERGQARAAAAGAVVLLGLGKELLDVRGGRAFSPKDLAWDAAGLALGLTFVGQVN